MKLKRDIAKLDDVPEAQRGFYETNNAGGFSLKTEFELPDSPDVSALTAKRDELLNEVKKLRTDYTSLEQKFAGIDPDKVKADAAKQKTDADRIADIETRLNAERTAREAAELRANVQLIRSEAASAISAGKGRPGADMLLMPFILGDGIERPSRAKVVDGRIQIFQADGKTPMLDAKGQPASMSALVEEMKKEDLYAPAFEATGIGGGGAPSRSFPAAQTGAVQINSRDAAAMGASLEDIATGKAVVTSSE
jgi:hypothetical protein